VQRIDRLAGTALGLRNKSLRQERARAPDGRRRQLDAVPGGPQDTGGCLEGAGVW
jgi:hypothetical protein